MRSKETVRQNSNKGELSMTKSTACRVHLLQTVQSKLMHEQSDQYQLLCVTLRTSSENQMCRYSDNCLK